MTYRGTKRIDEIGFNRPKRGTRVDRLGFTNPKEVKKQEAASARMIRGRMSQGEAAEVRSIGNWYRSKGWRIARDNRVYSPQGLFVGRLEPISWMRMKNTPYIWDKKGVEAFRRKQRKNPLKRNPLTWGPGLGIY